MEERMSQEQFERVQYILDRQDKAYRYGPVGTFTQRWIPGVCKHEVTRCTHGDEIIARGFKRQVCLICGRALNRPLPYMCYFTGEPHPSWINDEE